MTEEQKQTIDNMSHYDMASLWRNAPSGHPYFVSGTELTEYFMKRYNELGGMSPELSKQIGWDVKND